jgi:hypothetical protein
MQRKDELERAHEMRGDVTERPPLAERLEDEPEPALLEIAETPVHQPARA